MEMRCCGGGWGWVLLLLLKLMPLKSQPAQPPRAARGQGQPRGQERVGTVAHGQLGQQERALARCAPCIAAVTMESSGSPRTGHKGGWPRPQPHAAAPLPEGLSTVMFYSPHTPLLKCKKRKKSQQGVVHSKNPKHDL